MIAIGSSPGVCKRLNLIQYLRNNGTSLLLSFSEVAKCVTLAPPFGKLK